MSRARPSSPARTANAAHRDLVVLAADKDAAEAVKGLLGRTQSFGIREIQFDVIVHPQHDPGCVGQSRGLLAAYRRTHRHAMVVFDRDGCGREESSREELETEVELQLQPDWAANAATIVIDPELEEWLWSPSPHVAAALGWRDASMDVRQWLVEQNWLTVSGQSKPERPKEAMEAVLRHVRKPRSSAIYREIADRVSFRTCIDPAFAKFRETLGRWFSIAG